MYFTTEEVEETMEYDGIYGTQYWSALVTRRKYVENPKAADFQTSEVKDRPGYHSIVLDVDKEITVRPSKTPGNHHLIIHRVIKWRQYKKLLKALMKAGVIEKDWYKSCIEDGFTTVRLYK